MPMTLRAERHASAFLTDTATIRRKSAVADSTGGIPGGMQTVASQVPCSFQPYRVPGILEVGAGRIVAEDRFTAVFPRRIKGKTLALEADDVILVRSQQLILQTPQTPFTRGLLQMWLVTRLP